MGCWMFMWMVLLITGTFIMCIGGYLSGDVGGLIFTFLASLFSYAAGFIHRDTCRFNSYYED